VEGSVPEDNVPEPQPGDPVPDEQRNTLLEARMTQLGIDFKPPVYAAISAIRKDEASQVRESVNRGRAEMVDRMATQMQAGAVLPPIIVNEADMVLDEGNTRLAAHMKIGRHAIAVYLIKARSLAARRQLAAWCNATHGQPLTPTETVRLAEEWINQGIPQEKIAEMLDVRVDYVRRVSRELEFQERAARLNVQAPTLTRATQRSIAQAAKNDPVFVELTRLAEAAGLTQSDVDKIGRDLASARSDQAAVKVLEAERERRGEQIDQRQRGIQKPIPNYSTQLAMHLSWVLKRSVTDLVEYNPDRRRRAIEEVRQAYVLLGNLLRAYDEDPMNAEAA